MSRRPSLTFVGALRILGKHESAVIGNLDSVLGSSILVAGTAAGAAAVIGTGPAFVPAAAMLAAVWGWVDQKNEATKLLQGLVGKLSDRMAGTRGVERRELIIAAHSTIAAAAFFEVMEERLSRQQMRELALTEEDRHALTLGQNKRATRTYYDSLYWSTIPAPSATCGFEQNIPRLHQWVIETTSASREFFSGLATGHKVFGVFGDDFTKKVVKRYTSHYLTLAQKAPEFVFWALLNEQSATRHQVEKLNAEVQAVLESHGQTLAELRTLLGLVSNRGIDMDQQRERLRKANAGVLGTLIVQSDTVHYDVDVTFPTIERAFVTPSYRTATYDKESRPADEGWWSSQPIAHNLGLMLAAHFVSANATSAPLLLLGHPGAGKSILMKVVAAQLPSEDYTVVRVPLRSVSAGAPIVDQIQQALGTISNHRLKWQTLSDQADTVLVVLLDGLDELLQATDLDRSGYLREVMEFQRIEGEQNRPVAVVVTSRTVVADRVDLPDGTIVVKLNEFDDDQVATWLDEWRFTNLSAIQSGAVRELTTTEALHRADLARQPLLLMMLAIYAADPKLPKLDAGDLSKSALYEQIFDSFARREAQKHSQPARPKDLERLVSEQVFRLSIAALAMFNRGAQSVREADVRSDLVAITRQNDLRDDEGSRLLGEFFFVHAAEATTRTTERAYEFLHATFGEYLVARMVMGELASLTYAAYGGRYQDRAPNDELLFALISHYVWAARPSIGDFAKEIFAKMSTNEKVDVRRALTDLLRSFRQRRRSTEYDAYRPTALDFVRQLATYSANLTTLSIRFSDDRDGLLLVGTFGDSRHEALTTWRATLSLWQSGLDRDSWIALLSTLNLKQEKRLVDSPPDLISFEDGRADYWAAMVGANRLQASRIRRGRALVDGVTYLGLGQDWADETLTLLQAQVFSTEDAEDLTGLIVAPPLGTRRADVAAVGDALCVLLRTRGRTLSKRFIIGAMQALAAFPKNYVVSANTVLAVAYMHPEVLLHVPKFQDRVFYADVSEALQVVVDHGKQLLDPELHREWKELRVRLLGTDVPEKFHPDTLGELFSHL